MATSIITSIVTGGTNNHATVSEEANAVATDFVTPGVVGTITNTGGVSPATGSFAVNQSGTPAMTVDISAGQAYVTGTPSGQSSQTLRARMASAYTAYVINANASGSVKYDWIYLKLDATTSANPSASADDVITLYTSRSTSNTSDNGTPPTYGKLLAVVTVSNGASSIVNANISDRRTATYIGSLPSTSGDWTTQSILPSSVVYNGNGSYTETYAQSVASIKSPGQRNEYTRTVTAPTQSTSLNGTNQYWVKTSPNKMTFTNNFVVDTYIKLTSYAASNIVGRFNGTSGWRLNINASGQVELWGYNGGAGNYKGVISHQSIQLNKWVRVTAQLDMTSLTISPTVSYIMIDGVDVPASPSQSGTNPTSLIQAGNLEIGAYNGGLSPFQGKIAQVAIFNAKVTQAQMRTYHSQGYLGTETSLASAYSFNGVATDLNTTTPNDLTAQNSAGYATDSPFTTQANDVPNGTTDYSITQSVSADGLTVVTQVPNGCTIPTSGGITGISYSGLKAPYGFPGDPGLWSVLTTSSTIYSQATPVQNTWYNLGSININAPIGLWKPKYDVLPYAYRLGTATNIQIEVSLSTSASAVSDSSMTRAIYMGVLASNAEAATSICMSKPSTLKLAAATPLYLITRTITASIGSLQNYNSSQALYITLENAYL